MRWSFLIDATSSRDLLLDCRSEAQYAAGTLPGAYGAALVKKPIGSGPKSQEFLNGMVQSIKKLAKDKETVICFDEGQGMYASRMVWILRSAGLKNVMLLSKKFSDIPAQGLKAGPGQIEAEETPGRGSPGMIILINNLQKELTRVQLIDARTPEEYEGELPRMISPEPGSMCGRIPGSINWDWRSLYNQDGVLRDKMDIIMDIKRMGFMQERPTVIYDFNGARSCTMALVMHCCGYRNISVYLGSWMEWRKSNLPKQNFHPWLN